MTARMSTERGRLPGFAGGISGSKMDNCSSGQVREIGFASSIGHGRVSIEIGLSPLHRSTQVKACLTKAPWLEFKPLALTVLSTIQLRDSGMGSREKSMVANHTEPWARSSRKSQADLA